MIPAFFIQELLSRTDIVDVVGKHIALKKTGINLKGLCPFHTEKSPSFTVSPSRQMYHCFGCGAHGDAIRFLCEHVGLGFIDAVKELAQQVGLVVPAEEQNPLAVAETKRLKAQQRSLQDILQNAAHYYQQQLQRSPDAIRYLKSRGIQADIANKFGLGWAPDTWRNLAHAYESYEDSLLEDAGLVIATDADGDKAKRYDRFRGRLMFPIQSVTGEIIGFGGRIIGAGEPKYLNSPETPVFIKGRELYGLYESRTSIRQAGYALVVEGYMDVVALSQFGVNNAVATLGTACTEDHLKKLFRFTDSVVFSFDGDLAGRKAAKRALEACLPLALDTRSIRFLFLPTEHDPDSFIREFGQESFKQKVESAVSLSAFFIQIAQENCDLALPEGRARFTMQAKPLWQGLPEGALRQQMLKLIAREVGASESDIASAWNPGGSTGHTPSGSAAHTPYVRSQNHLNRSIVPRLQSRPFAGRPVPKRPEDHLLHLLVTHPDWWNLLTPEDLELVHAMPAPYAHFVRWLEREIAHWGSRPWAVLRTALQETTDLQHWVSVIEGMMQGPQEPKAKDLRRILDTLLMRELEQQQTQLAELAAQDLTAMERYKHVYARWRELKTALTSASSSDGLA